MSPAIDVLHVAMAGDELSLVILDPAVLEVFTIVFFGFVSRVLAYRVA